MATSLQTIPEEINDPQLDGVDDLEQVKTLRTTAKRSHTRACNIVIDKVVNGKYDDLEINRSQLVSIFELVEARHKRYLELSDTTDDATQKMEDEWLQSITENHRTTLQAIDRALLQRANRAPSVRSEKSNASSSSARSKLLRSEVEAQKLELEIQQKDAEALLRQDEEARLQALESSRRAEEARITHERQQRELHDKLQRQRLSQQALRQQLEVTDGDGLSVFNGPAPSRLSIEPAESQLSIPLSLNQPQRAATAPIAWGHQPTPLNRPPPSRASGTGMMQRLCGYASRAIDAITPGRMQRANSRTSLNSGEITGQPQPIPQPTTYQTVTAPTAVEEPNPTYDAQDFIRRRPMPGQSGLDQLPRPTAVRTNQPGPEVPQRLAQQPAAPNLSAFAPEFTPIRYGDTHEQFDNQQLLSSPDRWIFEPDDMRRQSRSRQRPLKLQLMSFDGNPMNWPMFIQNFRVQVHDAVDTDEERIAHLNNCLPSWIRAQMGRLLMHAGLYRQAQAELYKRYGSQQVIAKTCSSTLEKLKPFGDDDYKGLSHFSSSLNSVVATLQLCGFTAELQSYATVALLLTKISPKLLDRWSIKTWEAQPNVPTLEDFASFIDNASMAEYSKRIGASTAVPQRAPRATTSTQVQSRPAIYATSIERECPVCKTKHSLKDCKQFRQLKPEKRAETVWKSAACIRCLEFGHRGRECTRSEACGAGGCKKLHHALLHSAPRIFPNSGPTEKAEQEVSSHFAGATLMGPTALLPIVPITLKANGRKVETLAFLDQGSEVTLLKAEIARQLRLDGPALTVAVDTVNGGATQKLIRLPEFSASARDGSASFTLCGALAIENLVIAYRQKSAVELGKSWPHLKDIAPQKPDLGQVTILIGADQPSAIEILEYRKDPLNPRAPRGLRTHFGWCVAGPAVSPGPANLTCNHAALPSNIDEIDSLIKGFRQFIGLESYGGGENRRAPLPPLVSRAIEIMQSSIKHIDGHYEVAIPFKEDDPKLPDNEKEVRRQFLGLEKRLLRDAKLCERYIAGMKETIALGHARKLTAEETAAVIPGRTWYNTHHPVINPKKPEKLRIVFNLAAIFSGVSLNSKLLKGPDLINNLVGVLLRLRTHPVAVVADIEKMFHQVRVPPKDRKVLRFFWRVPGSQEPPGVYEMTVHPFGATSSPAVCAYALQQAAKDSPTRSQEVLKEVLNNFYVDNWMNSFTDVSSTIKKSLLLIEALNRAGFNLTQFASSHREVLEALSRQAGKKRVIDLWLDDETVERALGLSWDLSRDAFQLSVNVPAEVATKRELLRVCSAIYDPLGLLAVVKLTPKRLFQQTCRTKVDWDDPLEEDIVNAWRNWASETVCLSNLSVPRSIYPITFKPTRIELHVFSDASEYAFGAVGYARYVDPSLAHCGFLAARSNLAPLRPSTIPRLELCGALAAARLARALVADSGLSFDAVWLWSDSTTVLRWVNSSSCKFTPYVAARIGEILELTDSRQWRYVPTALNPADDVSRGLPPADLHQAHRWFTGPEYLRRTPDEWPSAQVPLDEIHDPEIRRDPYVFLVARETDELEHLIARKSRFHRLVKIIARIKRLAANARLPKEQRRSGLLTAVEYDDSREYLIRYVQSVRYADELKCLKSHQPVSPRSPLTKLSPFLDKNGIVRVGGRLKHADMTPDARHPILLPHDHRLTRLIIEEVHRDVGHLTPGQTMVEIRQRYWITRARRTVTSVLHYCLKCRAERAQLVQPKMADLPPQRVAAGNPPFTCTGVDYMGPFEVSVFRRKVKRWICIFTCMSTRAVHLELAFSLSTDSFLSVLFRFEARRGVPKEYRSDNGSNFVGAKNELDECLQALDAEKLNDNLIRRGVQWKFNPPRAPHFGGVWERLVASAKRALFAILEGRALTDEVLTTALTQVESLLNSRPLTYVGGDPSDLEALTPNHFLLGRAHPHLPPDIFPDVDLTSRKIWRHSQTPNISLLA